MKISCIIVEDIQIAADFLRKFCEKSDLVEVKGHFLNVADALEFLDREKVDLLFLDVEMPGATGFDLLDSLTYSPKIILTTSKTEYAFDAFQYHVNDYLKKPFTYKRFLEAIQKLTQQQQVQAQSPEPTSIPAPQQTTTTTPDTDFLFIKSEDKLIKLKKDDILFLESMRDYVKFVTQGKSYITYSTLKNMEEKLIGPIFIKVHRSYIVNINKIDDIRGNTIYLLGNQVPIGKGHKDEVAARLNIL
ncbi:LytR/AlgR family response regulator transcription factor [Puia sp. P3]|uniref:LytR/AlgR family response regulator transcription factor n=1 Tax=Puia sp. P3 TaxID=3423952 RepID=UPI003D67A7F5